MDPEDLVLSLTRLRDFLVKRGVKELSLPVYDSNRGRLHPRELLALIHVIFSDTNIQVYSHKKDCLSMAECKLSVGLVMLYVICYVLLGPWVWKG